MGEELVSLELIDANPWQPRTYVDPVKAAELAESIREHGLLQAPAGRRMPDGRLQLAFGHRRLAAFRLLQREAPDTRYNLMPVDVVAWSDRQMAEHAAIETSQHEDFTAIDAANGMRRLIDEFGLTQLEAGKMFGLQTQGAVGNKLGLLKLPVEMRDLVQRGDLPERLARALRSLSQVDVKAAVTAAKVVAEAEPDERESQLYSELDRYVRGHGQKLNWTPWPLEWPEKPVPSGNVHVGDIPKCDGCAFNVRTDASDKKDRGCIRKACFSLKLKAWAEAEAACVAEKAGISVVGPKEKVSILYDGSDWKKREFAQLALASKHASLRTVPVYVKPRGNVYGVSSVSGSDYVLIASTDVSALRKAVAVAPKPEKRKLEAWERRAKAQEAAKRERAKQVRALLSNAAPAFAPVIPAALQELLYRELRFDLPGRTSGETDATWRKASVDERGGMIADVLLKKHVGLASWSVPGVDVVTKKVTALAKAAGVKLPRGWDAAPSANSKPQTPKPKGAKKKR